jgi:hypothetical protein
MYENEIQKHVKIMLFFDPGAWEEFFLANSQHSFGLQYMAKFSTKSCIVACKTDRQGGNIQTARMK